MKRNFLIIIISLTIINLSGQSIYNNSFVDLKGDTLKLNNYRGGIVYINVWQPWCEPCIDEIPNLNRLSKIHSKIKFISITPSPQKKCNRVLQKHPFEFNVVCNLDTFCKNVLKVKKYPAHLIIDKNGNIKEINTSHLWPSENPDMDIDEKFNLYLQRSFDYLNEELKKVSEI